ncbi:alpha-1-3-Fucosyl transferase [Venturia nashicola]|uniref:Alpha-1-3-Fucosyl transferase n=1 Tax=Venturia nashicola TaxID=86259 RepID=A0A4Z1NGA7_9PEZI|nr:alpha-1-3-Fucosyl transferase [Venturia nashicola]TLD18820.1 alpha-1-3-Fucosyl transferase [Venturia nashicola]
MSIIKPTPQAPNLSQQIITPTGHATKCTPKPDSEEQDWRTKYKNLKVKYDDLNTGHDDLKIKHDDLKIKHDDLKTEYEMLQDKCNKMFSHADGTMEDEDMFSVWLDNDESEV